MTQKDFEAGSMGSQFSEGLAFPTPQLSPSGSLPRKRLLSTVTVWLINFKYPGCCGLQG